MAYLIFHDQSRKETIHVYDDAEFHLGRTADNDLAVLDDPLVSRKHCSIRPHKEERNFILRDLSSNGTSINGRLLNGEEASLSDGDIITLGSAEFIFCMDKPERYDMSKTAMIKYGMIKKGQDAPGNSGVQSQETLKFRYIDLPEMADSAAASHHRPESSSSLAPGMEINGYRIVRILSKGGSSTVYLALQEKLQRTVVLKIYSEKADTESKLSFRDAVPKVGRISHANVIHHHDCGIFDDFCYVVMPYLPEGNLDGMISRQAPLGEKEAACIIRKIAVALDCAMSEHCILHLDLNPGNVLFSDDGEPVVSGLGMSQWEVRSRQRQRTFFYGNPVYMSPEQALDQHADWRSDLYSLGIIFYEMLTGRTPFKAPDEQTMISRHVSEKIIFPPNMTRAAVSIITTMTDKNPADRFKSWGAFISSLDHLAGTKKRTSPLREMPPVMMSGRKPGKAMKKNALSKLAN